MNKPIRVVISQPMVSVAMSVPEIKASSVPAISLTQNYPRPAKSPADKRRDARRGQERGSALSAFLEGVGLSYNAT